MERRICKSRILAGVVIMLALFLSVSQPAFAAPSQSGKSGLLLAPSADTLGQGSLAIGYSRLGLTDCVYINAGVIPNLEVGLGSRGFGFGAEVYPMLKFRLMGETADLPAVAVGLEGQALYLAASKRLLSSGPRAHLGFGTGKFSGVFIGLDHVLNPVTISSGSGIPVPVTTLMGEYVGGSFNIGARFEFPKGLSFSIGLLDTSRLSAGVSFTTSF
ncbi:MAG: YjbH domain-containing protein [Bacillota bacterium]|nr:YjbH domain-containing protein [Bacillota bacterium]MDI9415622.1 YjbH domain-containing protein [Bacillota bacterium]NLD12936.1 YjbH domain-containing protein [Bacillota bacterium]HOB88578.1 YjbH domain-containing protein [Bacillota bacterium]HOJ57794.1 YjbH domain-containing protein [Bacillota bacterium]